MAAARPAAPSRRRTSLLVAAAYGTALLAAATLFLAYRIYSRHATLSQRGFFWTGDMHMDDRMGFRMRPHRHGLAVLNYGLHDPARQVPVHTDQMGLRVPAGIDSTPVVPGGLAAIGCSCTFAHGVAAESSYVVLAGARLDLPAYNLGVCAYSAVTSLMLLQDRIGTLRPRFVIYGFGNFHLERAARPRADEELWQACARLEDGRIHIEPPAFDNRRVFGAAPRIEVLYNLPRLDGDATRFDAARLRALLPLALQDVGRALHPSTWGVRFAPAALPDTSLCRFVLGAMHDTCRREGAVFVLLWFPVGFGDVPNPGLRAAATELGAAPDFVYVDASPGLFAGVRDQSEYSARWQVPRDGHPNRFMHLEMARAVAAALRPGTPTAATP